MRVAIVNLTNGGLSGGYLKYLCRIIPYFEQNKQVSDLHLFVPPVFSNLGLFRTSQLHTWPTLDAALGFPRLKQQLHQMALDVVFFPTARRIDCGAVPTVVMVRNMEPLVSHIRGNSLGEAAKNAVRAFAAKTACKQANRVIAVSQYVSHFLLKQWQICPEKIGVIYHGTDQSAVRDELSPPPQIPLDWRKSFLFTAGSIRPARGLEDIFCAMKQLLSEDIDGSKLIIAGDVHRNMIRYQKKLKRWIETHGLSSRICWAGPLNETEMAWCYRNCRIFIMTSRVEACPNIALEAMSHGCVCITADNPPLPEIFANSSIYYPPGNGNVLAETIKTVLAWSDNQRKTLSEQAEKRSAEFSWDVCAERTVAELTKAIKDFKLDGGFCQ